MKLIYAAALLPLLFSIRCVSQHTTVARFALEIDSRKANYEAIIPQPLSKEFFDNKAAGYSTRPTPVNGVLLTSILRRMKLVSISRDVLNNYRKVVRKRGKVEIHVSGVSHPAFFQSAIIGRRLYVIDGLNTLDGLDVFNRLIRDLNLTLKTPDEARQLTEFYLLFKTIRFRDPKAIIISSVEDISRSQREERLERTALARDTIHPVQIVERENHYEVTLFTWEDFPRGEVNKWQFKVSKNGEINVAVELVTLI